VSDNPWITIDQSSKNTTYASLSGIIITGLPSAGKSVFNIETSYVQLQCSNGQEFLPQNNSNSGGLTTDYSYVFSEGLQYHNATDPFTAPVYEYSSAYNQTSSFFLDTSYPRVMDLGTSTSLNLLYGSQWNGDYPDDMLLINCTFGTARAKAAVSCEGPFCTVLSM